MASDAERVVREFFDRLWNAGDDAATATGRPVQVDGMSFDHVVAGRIVEDWTGWDRGGLARQLPDEFGA